LQRSTIYVELITSAGDTVSLLASEVDINMSLSEAVSSCELNIDKEALGTIDPKVGNTITVEIGRGGLSYQVFSGRIYEVSKRFEGKTPRWVSIGARGFEDYCNYRYVTGLYSGSISQIFKDIIQPLVDEGKLTYNNVYSSPETGAIETDNISMWEALQSVAEKYDWDFYVDQFRDLHAFPRGTLVTSNTFENILSLDYTVNSDRIINSQQVVGKTGATLGTDSTWSDGSPCDIYWYGMYGTDVS